MSANMDTLRKTAEAATPGPWVACSERDPDGTRRYTVNPDRELDTDVCAMGYDVPGSANVEFIATFNPETVLALLSRLEQAEQAVQRVRALCMTTDGDPIDPDFDGNTVGDILRALDGDGRG